jgi:hypothetical protein
MSTMNQEVRFPARVYQRVGTFHSSYPCRGEALRPSGVTTDRYGLLFFWPRNALWLKLRVQGGDRDLGGLPQDLEAVLEVHRTPSQAILPPDFNDYQWVAGDVLRETPLRLEFTVETDDDTFRRAVSERSEEDQVKERLVQVIHVVAFSNPHLNGGRKHPHAPWAGAVQSEPGQINLILQPVRPVSRYPGCVALDLGNSNSTLVSMPSGSDETDDLQVLDISGERGQLVRTCPPSPSSVRIDAVYTWDPQALAPAGDGVRAIRRFPGALHDFSPRALAWVVGQKANVGTVRGLILGAKRLVAGKNWEEVRNVEVDHHIEVEGDAQLLRERVEFLNRVPAELLACGLFQLFRGAPRDVEGNPCGWTGDLALTYPTTYSPQEVERLCRTVYRGWLRAQFKSDLPTQAKPGGDIELDRLSMELQRRLQTPFGRSVISEDPLVRLLIDEASAAAFFFLYRKIFETPGGLATFNYHYRDAPNSHGLNLLLYDCGGGTTDIALVTAFTERDNPNRLHLKVRGRTGLRHFGGDDITWAVCRLLKAKMAWMLSKVRDLDARQRPPEPRGPERGGEWGNALETRGVSEQRLARRKDVLEFLGRMEHYDAEVPAKGFPLVPTRFNFPGAEETVDNPDARREHTMTLWQWGEHIKGALETKESAGLADLDVKLGPHQSKLAGALLRIGEGEVADTTELIRQLERVVVHRWEVDALIGKYVERSAVLCAHLIRTKLTPHDEAGNPADPDREEPLHWVVVTGNGARYPLIREILRQQIRIDPREQEESFTLDSENLKHAVAKGAALALATMRAKGLVKVDFDTKLHECLPFEVGYRDERVKLFRTLFHDQVPYEELGERTVPRTALTTGGTPEEHQALVEFTLWRRFPGDGDGITEEDRNDPDERIRKLARNDGWAVYRTFHFRDGIQGNLNIHYDGEGHEFVVKDDQGESDPPQEVGPKDLFIPPTERGDL